MYMAAAIHHKSGLPIGLMTVTHPCGVRLGHAWIDLPDGKCLDIQGVQRFEQMNEWANDVELEFKVYRNTTLQHLEELSRANLSVDDEEVQLALEIALERRLI
jgi:hypothetical protein